MSLIVPSSAGICAPPMRVLSSRDGRRVYGANSDMFMRAGSRVFHREIVSASYCNSSYKPISFEEKVKNGAYGLKFDFSREVNVRNTRGALIKDSQDISDLFEEAKVDRKNPSGLVGRKVLSYECAFVSLGFSLNVPDDQILRRYFV